MDLPPRGMARHLAALEDVARVAEDLRDELAEREAAHEHHALLAKCGKHPVVGPRDEAGGDRHSLLPRARTVEADTPLPLQEDHPRVEQAQATHVTVREEQALGRDLRIGRGVGAAVLAQNREEPNVRIGVAQARVRLGDHRSLR